MRVVGFGWRGRGGEGKEDVTELPLLSSGWRIKYKVLVLSVPTSIVEDQTLVIAVELCRTRDIPIFPFTSGMNGSLWTFNSTGQTTVVIVVITASADMSGDSQQLLSEQPGHPPQS